MVRVLVHAVKQVHGCDIVLFVPMVVLVVLVVVAVLAVLLRRMLWLLVQAETVGAGKGAVLLVACF